MSNEDSRSKLNNSQLIVETSKRLPTNVSELVMAWARDIHTGGAIYIGELGKDRRGASCNCECISCKANLVAVNAAKNDFIKRPHFRHPAGTERDSCSVLTARAAALKMFTELGLIELPSYRKSGSFIGFSGKTYNAWVNVPSEKVAVRAFHLRDSVTAELTLEDGRKVRVVLIGEFDAFTSNSNSENETRNPITTIRLCVDSPEVAGMEPAELRKKLVLLLQQGQWCDYWNEAQLTTQANTLAAAEASNLMDWSNDDELQQMLPSTASELLKRETLLHLKAKQILANAKMLKIPDEVIEASADLPDDDVLHTSAKLLGGYIQIESAELEKSQGNVRPDVLIQTLPNSWWPGGPLMVEVTVSNHIDRERLLKIQQKKMPTLEIDLSTFGGVVTVEHFERILLNEVHSKRWLWHPIARIEQEKLQREVSMKADREWERQNELMAEIEAKAVILQKPLEVLAAEYLQAVEAFADIRVENQRAKDAYANSSSREALKTQLFQPKQEYFDAKSRLDFSAKTLVWSNYQEAGSSQLIGYSGCMLERLLSIKKDRAIGYKVQTAWQVINAIQQEQAQWAKWHTIYLIAIRVYQPTLTKSQKELVGIWRTDVKNSLRNGEPTYRRSREYDSLLGLLFPEMAVFLRQALPNKMASEFERLIVSGKSEKLNAYSADEAAYWLVGKELETWARLNPERAKEWESRLKES